MKLRWKQYVDNTCNVAHMRYMHVWCYMYYASNKACTYEMHVQVQVEMYECKLKCVQVHENHGTQLHTCDCMHVLCDMWYVGYHRLGIPRKVRLKRPKGRAQ